MIRRETSKDHAAQIAALAEGAFKDHVLSWNERHRAWHCASPTSGHYHFSVYIAPGVTFIWGDLGELALRHSDVDALGWLLTQGRKETRYVDYFLGKVSAVSGEPKTEFHVGDALKHIDERLADEMASNACDRCKAEPDVRGRLRHADGCPEDDGGEPDQVDLDPRWFAIKQAFLDAIEYPGDEQRAWHEAWCDVMHDGDSPSCEGPSSGVLWMWHAVHTFARLYDAGGFADGQKERDA